MVSCGRELHVRLLRLRVGRHAAGKICFAVIIGKEIAKNINSEDLPTARIELTTLSLLVTRSTTEPCGRGLLLRTGWGALTI